MDVSANLQRVVWICVRSFLILCFIIAAFPCYGSDKSSFEPWDYNSIDNSSKQEKSVDVSSRILIRGIKVYQKYISPIRGGQCPMYPSCSEYSIQAIKKHGFFIGIVMTADRFIHELDESDYAPLVKKGEYFRFLDPVENNDFWWCNKKEKGNVK
jgi:putative membrane protein insertion efficiency factor